MTPAIHSKLAIPAGLNQVIFVLSILIVSGSLWLASHAATVWTMIAAAIVFSFVNNTIFALLHEAVHGALHPNRRINDTMGRLTACFFPTSFSIQQAFHLTHHRHNRTPDEQFDLIRPGDNKLLKYAQWYCILTGLYGLSPSIFCLLYAIWPGLFRLPGWARNDTGIGHQTSAAIYFDAVKKIPMWHVRAEVALAIFVQIALFQLLDLHFAAWLLCHACFVVNWSALQYADHAFSPLNPKDGAWNLKVNPLTRMLFLNYHYHLAHHQAPQVPWLHLPKLVPPGSEQPAFWRIYLCMWRGPQPIEKFEAGSHQ
ncbi:MAG TPA: fatty acid desaturase [Dongiaceae bacterium]|nr:fatty acid desaturase [Dongiaceae bacterium]